MTEIAIDIDKLKPFNCRYYKHKTHLSLSRCIGYCVYDDLSLQYCTCAGGECDKYEEKKGVYDNEGL